ncbi:MAG: nucleotidyltransferase domain-containing protein [Nanoarchaeota archaeon]|nr:nucleotidyltransferase domain-containing protein [Nanoarchaeota archaeon]MBU1622798.1 nucleotidyltransferase domain-containing protein [Nanoarchaeota archaeon]MBU1974537.1 nucleotidyltransferase domain-containing protein [Nanoarchaeota archaeon]
MANEKKTILKYLIEHKEEKFSINQLAKIRKINYKSAYQNIEKLEKRGVIRVEKLGNITLCSFNYHFDPLVFKVEWERREEIKKNRIIKSICRELETIEVSYFTVLLFGSYAQGSQTKNSDLDLLVIVDEKNIEKGIKRTLSRLPYDVHGTYVNSTEFFLMIKSREFSVIEEVKKNNVILYGIENYYQLIKNVRH